MAHELNLLHYYWILFPVSPLPAAAAGIVNSISRVAAAAVPPQLFARPTENFSQKAEREMKGTLFATRRTAERLILFWTGLEGERELIHPK